MREVRCHECGKVIESIDDLMVVWIYLSIVPLCTQCFGEIHKKTWFVINPRTPINRGFWGRIAWTLIPYSVIMLIVTAKVASFKTPWWVYALIWWPVWFLFPLALVIRYVSWVRYEKPILEKESRAQ